MHPALEKDLRLVRQFARLAAKFLADGGAAVGGEQFRADLKAVRKNESEFLKALAFAKHLYPSDDYPGGMTERDVKPEYLKRYPFMAAAALIDAAQRFKLLSGHLSACQSVCLEQCHDYAVRYSRVIWLSDVLKMSDAFTANFVKRQKENASAGRPDALGGIIEEIVAKHPSATSKEVLTQLMARVPGPVIETITGDSPEDVIEWTDDDRTAKTTPVSGLKDRVSRAKKKLRSR